MNQRAYIDVLHEEKRVSWDDLMVRASAIAGRDITSLSQLTTPEASDLIEEMKDLP